VYLRQFSENFDEADDEKQRGRNIDPECDRRNAERRESQSRCDDNKLFETAQLDLQRGTLPSGEFEWAILKFPTKGDNQARPPSGEECYSAVHH